MPAEYQAPPLNRRIIIRNAQDATVEDGFNDIGLPNGPVTYPNQIETWASKREFQGQFETPKGATVITGKSIFTIRKTAGIRPGDTVIDHGVPYIMQSAPVERGQRGGSFTHYELHCERKTGAAT